MIDEEQFNLQNSRLLARKKQIQERLKELEDALARQDKAQADFEAVRTVLKDLTFRATELKPAVMELRQATSARGESSTGGFE